MSNVKNMPQIIGATALALLLSSAPLYAQTSSSNQAGSTAANSSQSSGSSQDAGSRIKSGAAESNAPGQPAGAVTSGGATESNRSTGASGSRSEASSGASQSANSDKGGIGNDPKEMMEDMAEAHLAEIETGKMALEKSQNPQVKKYAQQMIDDHTKALQELQKVAQSKGVTLPTETDMQHKTIATALKALSGDAFDSQYISRAGVGDHERTVEMWQKTAKNSKDKELQAYAKKTAPVVEKHLKMAKDLEKQMEKKK